MDTIEEVKIEYQKAIAEYQDLQNRIEAERFDLNAILSTKKVLAKEAELEIDRANLAAKIADFELEKKRLIAQVESERDGIAQTINFLKLERAEVEAAKRVYEERLVDAAAEMREVEQIRIGLHAQQESIASLEADIRESKAKLNEAETELKHQSQLLKTEIAAVQAERVIYSTLDSERAAFEAEKKEFKVAQDNLFVREKALIELERQLNEQRMDLDQQRSILASQLK